jgi:NAD(P)-dependent dehydrogenase (short-subunit alcohol dehydrogenase family)
MGSLDGRVAIITGAGRGIGREHALLFAAEGARVVVNDVDRVPAEEVCAEIRAAGGQAVADTDDVSTWAGGERLVGTALSAFGDVHVLVNNAGFLRDRAFVNMTEAEWDDVVCVHLKGHVAATRFAAAHWRARSKAGHAVRASVINTSSTSGLVGNPGQSNYGAAKAGIASLTVILAQELARYGVRVNALAPAARTRLTEAAPGISDLVRPPDDGQQFDLWDAANVAPIAAYLATETAPETGHVYFVQGGQVRLFEGWTMSAAIERVGRWTVEELASEMPKLQPDLR